MTAHTLDTWADVERVLFEQPLGAVLRLPKAMLPHPGVEEMPRTFSLPEGQLADYRAPLGDGGTMHVREFSLWYEAHREPPVARVRGDAGVGGEPVPALTGGMALGAALGGALGTTERAVMAGALLGGLAAALVVSAARDTGPKWRR